MYKINNEKLNALNILIDVNKHLLNLQPELSPWKKILRLAIEAMVQEGPIASNHIGNNIKSSVVADLDNMVAIKTKIPD